MQRHDVESSMIHSIGYNPEAHTLEVEFEEDHNIYQYFPVEPWVPTALMMAPSAGKAFWQLVRGNSDYTYIQVQ